MNLAALVLGGSTGTIGAAAAWLGQTSPTPDATNIGALVGGGGGAVAVVVLGEVTRRLMNGRLIARETRETEQEMAAYITAAGQREDRAMKVAEDAAGMVVHTAEALRMHNAKLAADLADVAAKQSEAMGREVQTLKEVVEDLRTEVRELRRGSRP